MQALIDYTMQFYHSVNYGFKPTEEECRIAIKQAQIEDPSWPSEDGSIEREMLRWMIEANRRGEKMSLRAALQETLSYGEQDEKFAQN